MAGGRLPQQLQHWPGFCALDWMLGPLSPALICISPSASDPCSRACFVTLWCNRLHLTGTAVDCWCTPRCLWSASIAPWHGLLYNNCQYIGHHDQGVFTTVYELRRGFMTLANINCCVSSCAHAIARRGRVSSYQLSVFGFQIMAVFGRIRIVHLDHYSVRFEFESNIWYSPNCYNKHHRYWHNA